MVLAKQVTTMVKNPVRVRTTTYLLDVSSLTVAVAFGLEDNIQDASLTHMAFFSVKML